MTSDDDFFELPPSSNILTSANMKFMPQELRSFSLLVNDPLLRHSRKKQPIEGSFKMAMEKFDKKTTIKNIMNSFKEGK
jgi:hypothetical protein